MESYAPKSTRVFRADEYRFPRILVEMLTG